MDLKVTKKYFLGTLSTLSHCLSPVIHEMMVRGKLECKNKTKMIFHICPYMLRYSI